MYNPGHHPPPVSSLPPSQVGRLREDALDWHCRPSGGGGVWRRRSGHDAGMSPVQVVGLDVGGDLRLPAVSVTQQLLLVVQQLLVSLRRELKVGALQYDTCATQPRAGDTLTRFNQLQWAFIGDSNRNQKTTNYSLSSPFLVHEPVDLWTLITRTRHKHPH